ncbi:hypothetical protein NDU88_005510 [Pleurodeles waltl]|uniref:Uncharacterized protein n=1 Tax=Pleurodeles waltl TaxID=8319 RepID=A0AAV7L1H4_PLEWA|nr:hypothetical protein NDU88_005510 [Pleurodeles waltl]
MDRGLMSPAATDHVKEKTGETKQFQPLPPALRSVPDRTLGSARARPPPRGCPLRLISVIGPRSPHLLPPDPCFKPLPPAPEPGRSLNLPGARVRRCPVPGVQAGLCDPRAQARTSLPGHSCTIKETLEAALKIRARPV